MVKTEVQNKVIIGSRESRLAVLQSEMVRDYIKTQHPELDVEILTMKTTGDKILDRTLDKVGGKGLFVKELDKALLEGRTMLSVHSLKDMPMEVPGELPLLAFQREKIRGMFWCSRRESVNWILRNRWDVQAFGVRFSLKNYIRKWK